MIVNLIKKNVIYNKVVVIIFSHRMIALVTLILNIYVSDFLGCEKEAKIWIGVKI